MEGINRVQLLGNLGQDPEIKQVGEDQRLMVRFRLATNRRVKTGDDWTEVTYWHNCVCWGHHAKVAQEHLRAGSTAYLEGFLHSHSYDTNDGDKRYVTDVVVSYLRAIPKS